MSDDRLEPLTPTPMPRDRPEGTTAWSDDVGLPGESRRLAWTIVRDDQATFDIHVLWDTRDLDEAMDAAVAHARAFFGPKSSGGVVLATLGGADDAVRELYGPEVELGCLTTSAQPGTDRRVGYYQFRGETHVCGSCSWSGTGSRLSQGEIGPYGVELSCPECHHPVVWVPYPDEYETRLAAAEGNEEALGGVLGLRDHPLRAARVEATRRAPVADPAELCSGAVRCTLAVRIEDDGEPWLVLTANDMELHRELAYVDWSEPAQRLVGLMRRRYGDRLMRFDIDQGAEHYLAGGRRAVRRELAALVTDLPEQEDPADG